MLRYLRSRIGGSYEIKNDDLDDFISYTKLTVHGYPQKVSCFDFDEKSGLLAIGTRNGRLIIYYPNGAQIQSTIEGNSQIIAIYYFTDTNSLILLCNDGSKKDAQQFFRYQIIGDQMHSTRLDQEVHLKRITCCEVLPMNEDANSALLIGTKSGNIYALRVRNMELTEFLVFLDTSLSGVDELNKLPNSIDGILIHSKEFSKLFLLFNHSILIYYDKVHDSILRKFISSNEITHFSLGPDANSMFFSHTDGTYSILDVENGNHEVKKTFGGDVDCVKTTKIISSASLNDEQFIIFSGGIPDTLEYQNTITIFCGDKSLMLDFDSDIIDFKIYERKGIAYALFVLCEDEFVAIDLQDPLWRMFRPPYLYPIHSSPITCISAISGLSADAFLLLDRIGKEQRIASKIYSKNPWPLEKNQNSSKRNAEKQPKDLLLIITGHENGFVNIWLANNLSFQLWLQCNTARDFEGYKEEEYIGLTEDGRRNEEEKTLSSSNLLPPVRKAGIFDPFSDDFRLCIQRIHFDNVSGQFAVGGQAGQLMVYEGMAKEKIVPANELFLLDMTESSTADEIIANSNRATRNDSAIQPRSSPAKFPPGFSLVKNTIGQFKPPIPITAICWNSNNEILAAGNEFGYAILGLNRREIFLIKTLISSSDVVQISSKDSALSRFKSVKKSIRQSFRRKKKPNPDREEFGDKELTRFNRGEREIVQRRANPNALDGETPNSLVKMLSFKHCNLFPLNTNCFETFLFVGTHGGNVFIHALHHHQMDQRREEIASEECCPLIKEIRMQHQAPIIAIECLQFGHTVRLIIISEEQIRSFILPTLKPSNIKYRFTAVEGSRIKKAVLVQLTSRVRRIRNPEKFLAITTNRGEIFLIHPSNPKKPYRVQFTQPNDSAGVLSSAITSDGQLFFLKPGGSEFNRSSLCGNIIAKQCQN